jgi:hypothetical protein
MLVYLDSVIVIYYLDAADQFHQLAAQRLGALPAAGDEIAVSDLTRLECRVQPIQQADQQRLAIYKEVIPPQAVDDHFPNVYVKGQARKRDNGLVVTLFLVKARKSCPCDDGWRNIRSGNRRRENSKKEGQRRGFPYPLFMKQDSAQQGRS